MSMYMLLCNYTDQAIRNMKEMPSRRAAAQEKAKKLGVEIKAAYLALGIYDFIIHIEARDEETVATRLRSSMDEAFTSVWAKADTLSVSLRRCAFALALDRLAEAIEARGLFP